MKMRCIPGVAPGLPRKEYPPPGSSGIELDILTWLLEGFRPGHFVRIGSYTGGWPRIQPPPEWRMKSMDDRE
jgi:hypothetical protein